ncbi:NADP-dependent oxidoreductase [uncultured Sphingomonas sp.]|uniref:NADP-dependent oxidoreductase n=1 Tax=uncultured Sphingomonas sp. TaxID=158754 RepID=UPI0026070FAC|nr:NADP-dependent oxidoreductase [uncultured Sphingomonas sp.]
MPTNRRFLLERRPNGVPALADFRLAEAPVPVPGDGEFVVRTIYASLDPAMRGWLDDAPSYMPPIPLGDAVRASTVGRVAASRNADFPDGAWVSGLGAIEEYSLAQAGGFMRRVDPDAVPSPSNYLSVLGAVGMTAYFGVVDVLAAKAGQTLLVSGAAGAVGSLVGQIGKILGCRTIGIAGGPEKIARLTRDYKYDVGIDYRGKDRVTLEREIRAAAPDGVDLVFENVGGDILDATLSCLSPHATIALCGLISEYNSPEKIGARQLWQLIVHRASIRGFLVSDYLARFEEGGAQMAAWMQEGKLRFDEHIDHGIENALPAFLRLFDGTNEGKMILQIGEP